MDIRSIDRIYDELTKSKSNPDDLHKWSAAHKDLFEKSTAREIQQIYREIVNYVAQHQVYSQAEVARFLDGADPWLIASAKAKGAIIVTHEVIAPNNSTKVKIPNIAPEFEVECTDIYDLLELTVTRLVLDV